MKIVYYFKNLKVTKAVSDFLKKRLEKLNKFFGKKEALVEVELSKDKETKQKQGIYKAKIILDLPKKSLIIAQGIGKSISQAVNNSLEKLKKQLRRKS